jgi:hypothetical protein
MHPALCLEHVVANIVEAFWLDDDDVASLLALATTSRVFSDAALDAIWADVGAWDLAQRMDAAVWTVVKSEDERFEYHELVSRLMYTDPACIPKAGQDVTDTSAPLAHLGERFMGYARRVQTLTINDEDRPAQHTTSYTTTAPRTVLRQVSARVIQLWAAHGSVAVFPRLQRLETESPVFGGSWSLQTILNLIEKRHSLAALGLTIHSAGGGFCGQDVRLSTPLAGSLTILGSLGLGPLCSALLCAVVASSPRLRQVNLYNNTTADDISQLALLPELTSLTIMRLSGAPARVPLIPPDAFRNLESLTLHEECAEASIMLWHLFLALPPNKQLSKLKYDYKAYSRIQRAFPGIVDMTRFFAHVGAWTMLASVDFTVSATTDPRDMSVEQARALFRQMHSLHALAQLHITSHVRMPITPDIVGALLAHCPALSSWRIECRHPTISEPMSFRDLYDAVEGHCVGTLPVRMRCDTFPSLDEARELRPLFLERLTDCGIRDPTALGTFLARVCPCLTQILVEQSADPNSHQDLERAASAQQPMIAPVTPRQRRAR